MSGTKKVLEIDGSALEGGGQILRLAISLSALLAKPIRVVNIRSGRSKPGLMAQHLTGLKLVRDICGGTLEGGDMGSTAITFHPGKIKSGEFSADTGTAGSVMLLFQVAFPCLLFGDGDSKLHLTGGTNAEMAPQIDYTLSVFKPVMEMFGVKFHCEILKRGYFPRGGGKVVIHTFPLQESLEAVQMTDPGTIKKFSGFSFVAGNLPMKIAKITAESASTLFRGRFPDVPLRIERVQEPPNAAVGTGSGIVLMAETSTGCRLAGSALGRRGIQAEAVGEKAANELLEDIHNGGCVDRHLQDQLIIFMALADGKSKILTGQLTLHTETAIHVIKLLTDAKFSVTTSQDGTSCTIECEGIGLKRTN